ncbi:unnamed protein product [Pleuronectes platessa]|uniref:Uncharacterized protein n=1 Tax=Pleuronectes platessa TaxID=8262 RepID=A0A9N7VEV0_PLEPL|nr:unnamed protein product [Pleuronectes platessa]
MNIFLPLVREDCGQANRQDDNLTDTQRQRQRQTDRDQTEEHGSGSAFTQTQHSARCCIIRYLLSTLDQQLMWGLSFVFCGVILCGLWACDGDSMSGGGQPGNIYGPGGRLAGDVCTTRGLERTELEWAYDLEGPGTQFMARLSLLILEDGEQGVILATILTDGVKR